MKKTYAYILTAIVLSFFVCVGCPYMASAHTLKIDGPIGVTMHIDPDDAPPAHVPAKVFFYFKDETGKLDLDQCDCNVDISNGSSTLFSDSIHGSKVVTTNESTMTVSFPFVFPEKAVYLIQIAGTSTAASSSQTFMPFKVTFEQRVDQEGDASSSATLLQTLLGEHVAHVILFGGAMLSALYLIYIDRKEQAALKLKNKK